MTENMGKLFYDIMGTLFNCFPAEHINYCFSEDYPINPMMFGEYMVLEFVKYSYYESLEKHPLRYYFPYSAYDDDHSERMRYARALQYTQKYKNKNYKMFGEYVGWNPEEMKKCKELLGKDMSDMLKRTEGYELTEMDIFEHRNIQELRIIKAYVENRIISSKKISNTQFVELFEEYDEWVEALIERSKKSDADLLFSAMAFFTFEWKYSLEYIYLVASYMEKEKINEVDYLTLWATALPLNFKSQLGINIDVYNRLIGLRQLLIPDFIMEGPMNEKMKLYRTKYVEIVGLTALFNNMTSTEGGLYKDWFKNNSCLEDWASFIKEFEIFTVWHNKEWTNKKIKNARMIMEMMAPFKG